ncbi:MAG: MFS transporter, partial [Patescibacteria group bacterium]
KGSKKILLSTIFIWGMIVVLLAVAQTKELFYFAAISTGLVVGSSQSIARSWLSKIIPPEKEGEFFGFNGFASKISATTGPILFGTISVITANQRIAMISILPFFIISFIIFARIKEK